MSTIILLVEDDQQQRKLLKDILENAGYAIRDFASCEEAMLYLKSNSVDMVFSDWKLPQLSGLALLQFVRAKFPELGFVMATAHGTIEHAVEAMQAGADDYLAKPFQRQELLLSIEKALRAKALRAQNNALSEALDSQHQLLDFVGVSQAMKDVQNRIAKVANTDATVLITGESGTGKELAARALHRLSERRQHKFVAINCGAIPDELAEAELFGARKGAYTGANTDKTGKLQHADGGTLFLDEIGELPLNLQAKILRFLQEGCVMPLGSNEEVQLNVRVVAATHRNLSNMVAEGSFREDLFYRLNIVPINIPPLRERRDDIKLLSEFFYAKFAKRYGNQGAKPSVASNKELNEKLSKKQLEKLANYDWPGNVRQLSNQIERFVLLGEEDELFSSSENSKPHASNVEAPANFKLPSSGIDLDKLEADLLKQALSISNQNRTRAAKLLSLSYKAFLYRLEKHGIHVG
uniref:sigma-54-dependent transcriptional regulator n=1 Tax=Ningiella ruwaisensis TaxID=2364274 RepID=UPI0010A07863|nr:sigma-54 dependent transcriptional regulator [Ningiella ruwaisensis]